MSEEIDLQPFGVSKTKRLCVPAAEDILYTKREFPHGLIRLIDYMGGDEAIYHAMTGGVGAEVVHGLNHAKLFDSARAMGATNGFKFAQIKMHALMPIQSALYWVYHEDFSINEYSGRYSIMLDSGRTLGKEEVEDLLAKKLEGLSKRQGRQLVEHVEQTFSGSQHAARGLYEVFIAAGLARELARIGLGLGTHTTFYIGANLEQFMGAITQAKDLAHKHPHMKYLGPEAEEFEYIVKQVAPEGVASYLRGKQRKH